jgi:hypothetical protein
MANPEKENREPSARWDSLNGDVVEVTDMKWDDTVRPMSESLRKQLKLPPRPQPPTEPPPDNPAS